MLGNQIILRFGDSEIKKELGSLMNVDELISELGECSHEMSVVIHVEGRRCEIGEVSHDDEAVIIVAVPTSQVRVKLKQLFAALAKTDVPVVRAALLTQGESILNQAMEKGEVTEADGLELWEQLNG